jgi:hypothetical protein
MDSQTLARIRAELGLKLTESCTVLRPAPTVDDAGYTSDNFGTAVTGVACRLIPLNRRDRQDVKATQEIGRTYYRLVMPYDTDVRDGDRVALGTVTYEVLQIDGDRTDRVDKQATIARFG